MRIASPALFVTFSTLWVTSTAEPVNILRLPSVVGEALSGFVGSAIDAFSPQNLEKLWKDGQELGSQAGHMVLNEVTKTYSENSHVVGEFNQAVNNLVDQAHEVQGQLQTLVEKKKDVTIEHATEWLSKKIGGICEKLKVQGGPPPEDREERRGHCDGFLLIIRRTIMFLVALIIAAIFLPPILRLILNLFGFGLLGPIKGSFAACLQAICFGGAVVKDCWFTILQSFGMRMTGGPLWGVAVVCAVLLAILCFVIKFYSSYLQLVVCV